MSRNEDPAIWGIHAGRPVTPITGNCIELGWAKVEDLSALQPDRDAFKARVAEVFPEKKRLKTTHRGELP
jgi:restriction system protein